TPYLKGISSSQLFFRRYQSSNTDGDHALIDSTLRSVLAAFLQCLIIIVDDVGMQLFLPRAHCLLTSKNEYLYLICSMN
ncbi:hypothetical protein MXB_2193, partial [Myxobolus squamalis]